MLSYGIHLNGQVDYDTLIAINQSSLKPLLQRSPKHYLYRLHNPTASTKSQLRGTAGHCAVLEPERFAVDYVVFDGPRRAGKVWDAFAATHEGKTILKADEYAAALAFQRAVLDDPVAGPYFAGEGANEATMYWLDLLASLPCKARADRMTSLDGRPVIVDLKGTKDASPKWFGRDAANYSYLMQAAYYSDGYEVITGKTPLYVLVSVELAPPHDVVVYPLGEDKIALGRDDYRRALAKLVECRETGCYPGHANGQELELELPRWALPNEDDIGELGLEWGT